ncbi:MAG: hypothetical protein ORN58_02120, partial [Sediminibacterium sp.]|nr:hypothetical protein [Sediminibacterium sp.]
MILLQLNTPFNADSKIDLLNIDSTHNIGGIVNKFTTIFSNSFNSVVAYSDFPLITKINTVCNALATVFILFTILQKILNRTEQQLADGSVIKAPLKIKDLFSGMSLIVLIWLYQAFFPIIEKYFVVTFDNFSLSNGGSNPLTDELAFDIGQLTILFAENKLINTIAVSSDITILGINISGAIKGAVSIMQTPQYMLALFGANIALMCLSYLLLFAIFIERACILIVLNMLFPFVICLRFLPNNTSTIAKSTFIALNNYFKILLSTIIIFPIMALLFYVIDTTYVDIKTNIVTLDFFSDVQSNKQNLINEQNQKNEESYKNFKQDSIDLENQINGINEDNTNTKDLKENLDKKNSVKETGSMLSEIITFSRQTISTFIFLATPLIFILLPISFVFLGIKQKLYQTMKEV